MANDRGSWIGNLGFRIAEFIERWKAQKTFSPGAGGQRSEIRGQKSKIGGQMAAGSGQQAAGRIKTEVGGRRLDGRGQLISHMASPSLGHYASLTFVVRGGGWRSEVRSHWTGLKLISDL